MPRAASRNSALIKSLLVHLLVVLAFVVTIETTAPTTGQQQVETIKATMVSQAELDQAADRQEEIRRRERQAEQERQQRLEAERRRQREAEQEAQRQREAEAERKRQAELAAQREAEQEARRKAEAEAEAKRKAEEEARRKAEAEAKRKAEEEARRKAEAEARARREAELQAAAEAEERRLAAIRAGKQDEWIEMMRAKAFRYFSPPLNAGDSFFCSVNVRLIPGGEVGSVSAGRCDSEQLARAAENAVFKAAPFPMPEDPSVFERNVIFEFVPPDGE